jgi:hypothetical protein
MRDSTCDERALQPTVLIRELFQRDPSVVWVDIEKVAQDRNPWRLRDRIRHRAGKTIFVRNGCSKTCPQTSLYDKRHGGLGTLIL